MQKKSVLGSDPFEWLKGNNKKENTVDQKSDIAGQKKQIENPSDPIIDNKETVVKHEEKAYKPIDISDTSKPQENKIYEPVKVAEPYSRQEEKSFASSDISEANQKTVLGEDVYAHHAKPRETTQKDSPATAFVIVYTVLLLILGFIIYKDLTKQINKLETKLESVEKQLDAGLINYEDTKVDDVW
ncbi:MAG: hypothetical protein K8F52_03440 [Candidatus Scalindua rubra]|uniref:Uncharacterized protein n=1 Tax=Candidatus Scalindua brodae TaxID=237368 RepID=A0A0B0EG46_9BACT|nr:MAG: hypothetical protein SCABRO_02233 [Candidatus Scalindua brodae]MBZ0107699.1 hypothetical protein [Candidatus Scalindua rubra]TWU35543.1 hypothetical protein S225a_09070 [Candidatus Brocadiaceae bacterium S225]